MISSAFLNNTNFFRQTRNSLRVVAVLASIIMLAACSHSLEADHTNDFKKSAENIDAYLKSGVSEGYSGAVLIVKDGEIVLNQGYGLANKDEKIANTPDTVITIGSVTKQFTATAILLLNKQRKLSIDDPISRFFPNLPENKKNITIHQLLTHTSGLRSDIGDGDFDHIPTDEYFERLFGTSLLFTPGAKHEYSNAGYSVLARIIELCSEQEYELFLVNHIFKPSGMNQTGYLLPDWENKNVAHGYMRNIIDRGTLIDRFMEDGKVSWNLKGNGGIHSTLNDMYLWYHALEKNSVLSSIQTTELTMPYVPETDSESSHYAYGWAVFTSARNTKIISHNGGNGTFFFDFLWLPEDDALILFSTNASSRRVEVAWTVEKMLFDESYVPKPIIKNVYNFVFDFIENAQPTDIAVLEASLRSRYENDVNTPETLNRLGYMAMRSGQEPNWAVELFSLNTRLFPNDGNVWDSLGDAYLANGNRADAEQSFREAIGRGEQGSEAKLRKLLSETDNDSGGESLTRGQSEETER